MRWEWLPAFGADSAVAAGDTMTEPAATSEETAPATASRLRQSSFGCDGWIAATGLRRKLRRPWDAATTKKLNCVGRHL